MQFTIEDVIAHPFEQVYPTYRDRLSDLVPYLPDIDRVEVLKRSHKGGKVQILNKWVAKVEDVPAVVRKIIGVEEFFWLDHATWIDKERAVEWTFEMPRFEGYVEAGGRNEFQPEGKKTRVLLNGDFQIDLSKHPLMPRLLWRVVGSQVHKFFLDRIKPNLLATNRAVEKLLTAEKKKA